ncbi:MAG: nitrate reductase cytochrome c-type subunit [Rhodospirillaceae bacterium]|nr:nitrate reductase cytochrome c-type subunit [Rhodospirillaceae bacterium]
MKRMIVSTTTGLALALALTISLTPATVSAEGASSLRGDLALPEVKSPPQVFKLKLDQDKFERNFKTQPPLVPHKVAKYRVNLKVNRCLKCHDKANYKEEESPMAGKSHYMDASGKETAKLNMKRYFCMQCHVPQTDAKPLVANTFKGTK